MTPSDSQGQRRERGPEAHEDDPTGIRELLAALPDPGPMPEDLVRRIEARLAVEQVHRERGQDGGLAARSDSVVDLAAERSHRRPGRTVALLGAAAAGLLVATVAIGEFAGVGPASGPAFDSAAQVPTRAGADSADGGSAEEAPRDSAGGGSRDEAAEGRDDLAGALDADREGGAATGDTGGAESDAGGDVESLLSPLSADVIVLPALGAVGVDDYEDRIVEAAGDSGGMQAASEGGLTEAGATWCWQAVEPVEAWPTLRAAQAELDGDRVVVLLGMRDAAAGEAFILPWSCTSGAAVEPLDSVTWAP